MAINFVQSNNMHLWQSNMSYLTQNFILKIHGLVKQIVTDGNAFENAACIMSPILFWTPSANLSYAKARILKNYRKTSNIRLTLVGNKIVDHSDVVGASPVGVAPTTSSLPTWYLASMDWAKTTGRQDETHLKFVIWSTYIRVLMVG